MKRPAVPKKYPSIFKLAVLINAYFIVGFIFADVFTGEPKKKSSAFPLLIVWSRLSSCDGICCFSSFVRAAALLWHYHVDHRFDSRFGGRPLSCQDDAARGSPNSGGLLLRLCDGPVVHDALDAADGATARGSDGSRWHIVFGGSVAGRRRGLEQQAIIDSCFYFPSLIQSAHSFPKSLVESAQ